MGVTAGRTKTALRSRAIPVAGVQSPHLEIAADLRAMILDGRLTAGSTILEGQLRRQLGVSDTALRLALNILAGQRLIDLMPHNVVVVSHIAGEETAELFELLEGLEAAIGEIVVERITDAEIGELKALHRLMLDHHRSGRRGDYFAYNQRIHARLVECSRNRTLIREHIRHTQAISQVRSAANFTRESWDASVEEHCVIIAALERRDGPGLGAALRTHLRRTSSRIRASLRPA